MSIKAMTHVWEHSPQKSTNLLMLLAIADHCNDDGVCYPSISRLAHKCRLEERSAQKVLRKLEQAGEVSIVVNDTYHMGKPNLYYLNSYRESIGLPFVESYTPKRFLQDTSPTCPTGHLPPVLQDTSPPVLQDTLTINIDPSYKPSYISPYSPPKGDTDTAEEKKGSTKKKSQEDDHQAKEVIDYLNKATRRQFKHAISHLRYINARFKEGFTTNELKLVVNFKTRQWIDDPKMSQYLRPSTLFGTKADNYLQAAIQAGGNLEDPEAIVGISSTNNSTIGNITKNRGNYYAKNQPNYQPGRVPKTPWEKTAATIERVFGATNTTLDPDGKPVNPLFRNPDDYAF